jgi:AcrR family transcriptional regulator
LSIKTHTDGPRGRRETNRLEKTRRLIDAGLRVALEHGVEGATIERITRSADMAKGSFYRYFDDQSDLMTAILAPIVEPFRAAIDRCEQDLRIACSVDDQVEAYQRLALSLAPAMFEYKDVLRLYLQESRGPARGARQPLRALADEIRERAVTLTAVAQSAGRWRDVPGIVSALAVVGAIERLAWDALNGADIGDPLDVGAALVGVVLDGLRER